MGGLISQELPMRRPRASTLSSASASTSLMWRTSCVTPTMALLPCGHGQQPRQPSKAEPGGQVSSQGQSGAAAPSEGSGAGLRRTPHHYDASHARGIGPRLLLTLLPTATSSGHLATCAEQRPRGTPSWTTLDSAARPRADRHRAVIDSGSRPARDIRGMILDNASRRDAERPGRSRDRRRTACALENY